MFTSIFHEEVIYEAELTNEAEREVKKIMKELGKSSNKKDNIIGNGKTITCPDITTNQTFSILKKLGYKEDPFGTVDAYGQGDISSWGFRKILNKGSLVVTIVQYKSIKDSLKIFKPNGVKVRITYKK